MLPKQTVRLGSVGPDVLRLQELLRRLNLYDGKMDSKFGPKTEASLREYQGLNGLVVDGVAGPMTWAKLHESVPHEFVMTPEDTIVDITAQTEGGGRYDAFTPNDNGAGVSYGLIQFNSRKGTLPELLRRFCQADTETFMRIFADDALHALDASFVRTADLSQEPWPRRLRETAQYEQFRAVQRKLAIELYLRPVLEACERFGLRSQRAVSMAFDCAVQRGPETARNLLLAAYRKGGANEKAILKTFAALADKVKNSGNRRTKLLNSERLRDTPWDE